MGKGEWLTVAGLLVTVTLAGFTGLNRLEARLTKLERGFEQVVRIHNVTRTELIEVMKKASTLEGRHKEHVERHRRMPSK